MIKKLFTPFLLLMLLTACNGKQKDLSEYLTFESMWKHLEQFDKIARENDSTRAVGTPGGVASKLYIAETLQKLGMNSIEQNFINHSGARACNLTVDIKGKSEEVILVGAHYDSVLFGPGINDNASGVATLMEIITVLVQQKIIPNKTLRFAFWDSEETGVEGSRFYFNSLSEAKKEQIIAYINIDMIASKGGEIQISDADHSTVEEKLNELMQNGADDETIEMMNTFYGAMKFAEGSEKLEQLVKEVFEDLHTPTVEDLTFAMNSDTGPFFATIPTTGITVTRIMTETTENGEEAVLFAPCYHQACDDINNIDKNMLEVCMKAIAKIVQQLAL